MTEHLLNSLIWRMNQRGDMYLTGGKSPKRWALRRFMGPFISAMVTLLGTNISLQKGTFEDDFPFPQVGYVSSLEGTYSMVLTLPKHTKPSLGLVGRQVPCLGK